MRADHFENVQWTITLVSCSRRNNFPCHFGLFLIKVFCVTLEQAFNMVLFVLFRAARCGLYELLYF